MAVPAPTRCGAANIDATGNELNNTILGGAGDNRLDGQAGVDAMHGGSGNDVFIAVLSSISYTPPRREPHALRVGAGIGDLDGGVAGMVDDEEIVAEASTMPATPPSRSRTPAPTRC